MIPGWGSGHKLRGGVGSDGDFQEVKDELLGGIQGTTSDVHIFNCIVFLGTSCCVKEKHLALPASTWAAFVLSVRTFSWFPLPLRGRNSVCAALCGTGTEEAAGSHNAIIN